MSIDALFAYKRKRLSLFVDQKYIDSIKKAYITQKDLSGYAKQKSEVELLILFLFDEIDKSLNQAKWHIEFLQKFRKQLSLVSTTVERKKIILEYAYLLNQSKKDRYIDELALDRWFDEDALAERINSKIASYHRRAMIAVERIGAFVDVLTSEQTITDALWYSFDFNRHFLQLLHYQEEPLLLHQSFTTCIKIIQSFDTYHSLHLLDERLIEFIYRMALSRRNSVWVQNDAIEFLANTEFSAFLAVAKIRIHTLESDNDIFVRHKVATLMLQFSVEHPELIPLIKEIVIQDPSPYVRQAIVKQLPFITIDSLQGIKKELMLEDKENSVRAMSILQILEIKNNQKLEQEFQNLILLSLIQEEDSFVRKTALYTIAKYIEKRRREERVDEQFVLKSQEVMRDLIATDMEVSLKRYTTMMLEFIWVCSDTLRYETYISLQKVVEEIEPGRGVKLEKKFLSKKEELYRILSVIAQSDFSLELQYTLFNRAVLYRSDRMGRRMWRILYEFFHPSPDKRQAFFHTIARIYEGREHFPSAIMAEQAPTKVPGEPYYIPEEQSSRPFLPLADHYLSSLKQKTLQIYPYHIYSSDGVTKIEPPKGFFRRVKAEWLLSWNYSDIARLRNWQKSFTELPSAYVSAMQKLGFKTSFNPYIEGDSSVNKFFPITIPFVPYDLQESVSNYFVSAYENSLSDLALFLLVIFGLFFIRHVVISRQIQSARRQISLSIGGWGTRGKSGTERLKAALFNSLGLRVFSKTTGNEAMFLHSESFDSMREMYLFRPYDKATIWEQADTVILADKLGVDVYLWESMGLTPSYVEILQQRWMRDNIATITNTYPDHEDLQGPAGINIPQVMTNFIPADSTMVTTEEIMYPILSSYAKSVQTKSLSTGWLQAGLIAPDILSRFPYEEHPYNIALVLMMANELDIDEDVALKAMADNIVPDLGVLKAYPIAQVENKKLRFINGMSANERFGALGNWRRMGLGNMDDEKEPLAYLTTVINNRADRVSRSRVFASMVVEDIVADCHILIGSNISGFFNYLDESWSSYRDKLSLIDEHLDASQKLLQYAKKFRIIRSKEQLKERFHIMVDAYEIDEAIKEEAIERYDDLVALESLLTEYTQLLQLYLKFKKQHDEYELLVKMCREEQDKEMLNQAFRNQLWLWLRARVVPVYNYHATGNEVVQIISDNTPAGMTNHIIGMQNIKGTGLDFAYRWVAWNNCYQFCQAIQSDDSIRVREGIEALATFGDHGPLTFWLTQQTIEVAKHSVATQNEYYQSQIQQIEKNLEKSIEKSKKIDLIDEGSGESTSSLFDKLLETIESFLDAGDAVKRRKRANLIYKDLVNHHISHKRAAIELQAITKRQKGGWFVQRVKSLPWFRKSEL